MAKTSKNCSIGILSLRRFKTVFRKEIKLGFIWDKVPNLNVKLQLQNLKRSQWSMFRLFVTSGSVVHYFIHKLSGYECNRLWMCQRGVFSKSWGPPSIFRPRSNFRATKKRKMPRTEGKCLRKPLLIKCPSQCFSKCVGHRLILCHNVFSSVTTFGKACCFMQYIC